MESSSEEMVLKIFINIRIIIKKRWYYKLNFLLTIAFLIIKLT